MKNPITGILCISLLLALIPKLANSAANADALSEHRYADPKDYFTIVPPAGWSILKMIEARLLFFLQQKI